ncbi:MAG: EboA domain-containing protein [Planctomycetota bacterium]
MKVQDSKEWLAAVLADRLEGSLPASGAEWFQKACEEVGESDPSRFALLLSLCSRHAPRSGLDPTKAELDEAARVLPGWNPERWSCLEAMRVSLVLQRQDLAEEKGGEVIEEAFRFADEGEACALYKSLAHLPQPERFLWRAAEGCRTNIVPVFESVACDSPYAARYFDEVAFRQLAIKAVFIGAPLWRVHGLDGRLDSELARMALDLVEERRSAGRDVQPELWLCLGSHAGERGQAALEEELRQGPDAGKRAALLGLVRAGRSDLVQEHLDGPLSKTASFVLEHHQASDFSSLDPQAADAIL